MASATKQRKSLKSVILSYFIRKENFSVVLMIIVILIYIIIISVFLSTPLFKTQLFHIQKTFYEETIYPDENYVEKLSWSGVILLPHSEVYISFQTDQDVYLYIFNQDQYIIYLEKVIEGLSIRNLECVASIKDMDEGVISMVLTSFINPLYIIIDTNKSPSEVEILSLTYRYTIFEKSWYISALVIFMSFLILAFIFYRIKKKYNPWEYFHPLITEVAKKKFKDGHYDAAILAVFKDIESKFKEIANRKGYGFKYGSKVIDLLFNKDNPIIKFDIINSPNMQENYNLLFIASFRLIRNPIAHKNVFFVRYEALRQIGILDYLLKILESVKITCECGMETGFFDYFNKHDHKKSIV